MRYIQIVIFTVALLATLGSLYYGRFGDPVTNLQTGELFLRANGYPPCEMCWFARILMYPIVIIAGVGLFSNKFDYRSVLILSGLGILLEAYQYRYQMSSSSADVGSFLCSGLDKGSCAAIEVIYLGFITIPLLCLIAFVLIFLMTAIYYKKSKEA